MSSTSIQNFMLQTQLVDIFSLGYNDKDIPPTHVRGSTKIDHIMISPQVIPFVTSCGMTGFGSGYKSDHRALFVELCEICT